MTSPTEAGPIERRLFSVPRIAYLLAGLIAGLCAGALVELIASNDGHAFDTGSYLGTVAAADPMAPPTERGAAGPTLAAATGNAPQSAVAAHRGVLLAGLCVGIGAWDGATFAGGDTPGRAGRSAAGPGARLTSGGVSGADGGAEDPIRVRR